MEDTGPDIAHFRRKLEDRREALILAESDGAAGAKTVELDQTKVGRVSRIDAMQAQAMSVAASGRREQELARINAALARMDEGEYGYCLECGHAIADARLEIDPAATHCVKCASSLEQRD